MRRHLGVGRVVAEGREEQLAQAHGRRRIAGAPPDDAACRPQPHRARLLAFAPCPKAVTLLLIVVLVLAVVFDYINGFHDTANAIATSVSTRALRPAHAILMSATANFVGALTGTAVAKTIASGSSTTPDGDAGPDRRRRGAHRRDHLEPDHVAARHPELVEPRAHRRPARRRRSPPAGVSAVQLATASSTRSSSRSSPRRSSASSIGFAVHGRRC